jgi:Calpain family cysteine protease
VCLSLESVGEKRRSLLTSTASAVLPPNVYTQLLGRNVPRGVTTSESVEASYLAAKKDCQKKVAQIVSECTIINQKYSDPYFDLGDRGYCIVPLSVREKASSTDEPPDSQPAPTITPELNPPSVKRVGDIFDNPQFFVDGANAKDIRQGMDGDCWFLSALMAICNMSSTANLLTNLCVAWDQDVGVYGFVLFRDGEWISVIIDDKLYLRKPDYEDTDTQTRNIWEDNRIRINSAEAYRKEFQSNSRALYYAQSTDPNETWVPLIEKAFAKAHGDYGVIEAGSVG